MPRDTDDADRAGRLRIPEINPDLIDWLQLTHPNKVIQKGESLEDAYMRAGFQQCIELLQHFAGLQQAAKTDRDVADELYYEEPDSTSVDLVTRLSQPRPPRT